MAEGGQVPTRLEPFNTFINRVVTFLADVANQARLGVSDDNKDAMVNALGDTTTSGSWIYLWALTSSSTTATKPLRDSRNALQKTMSVLVRNVYDDIPESALTDSDRTTLLIPKRDKIPSERSKINTRPTLKLIVQGGARFIVENRVASDSTRTSMHPDADHVELVYCIQDEAPASPADCNKSKIFTKARAIWELDLADAKQNLHVYSRWVNATDDAKSSAFTILHTVVISN